MADIKKGNCGVECKNKGRTVDEAKKMERVEKNPVSRNHDIGIFAQFPIGKKLKWQPFKEL